MSALEKHADRFRGIIIIIINYNNKQTTKNNTYAESF